jgi:hypothetical protein
VRCVRGQVVRCCSPRSDCGAARRSAPSTGVTSTARCGTSLYECVRACVMCTIAGCRRLDSSDRRRASCSWPTSPTKVCVRVRVSACDRVISCCSATWQHVRHLRLACWRRYQMARVCVCACVLTSSRAAWIQRAACFTTDSAPQRRATGSRRR